MKISELLNHRNILIWGYGREGKATERFIKKFCKVKSLEIFEGKEDKINWEKYDFIIKSPGIPVLDYHDNYTSQTELFLTEFAAQTIGVTGTKGKSTTSALLHHVLSDCSGKKTVLVGNIGVPCLDLYEEIDGDTIIVFEMSCHQLSHIRKSPHVAVFLNLYEEHLDYYDTFDNYFAAKKNITLNQLENDVFYSGNDVPLFATRACRKLIDFHNIFPFKMKLKGAHNQFNANFVYRICTECFGCEDNAVRASIASFHGLEHRLEYVGNVGGIDYYNDSISTIPEATIQAINSVENTKTVIIGGLDRHIHYDILVDYIRNHFSYYYILSYASGKRIYESVKDLSCCYYVDDLTEATELARKITPIGKAVLLSPAAASYGYFKNFEERGNAFKKIILGE